MTRPYIELCRDLVGELGVAGGSGPSSVENQTGELRNIVRWVAEADIYVQNLWTDWKFMWAFEEGAFLPPGNNSIGAITAFAYPVESGLVLFSDTPTPHKPEYLDWREFRTRYGQNPKQRQTKASAWTVRPDGVLMLSHETTEDETHWLLEYQRHPIRLTSNTDLSPIPEHFERIILARAAIMYGTREDAPEIISGFGAEYADTLEKMEAAYLPGQRNHGRAEQLLIGPDLTGY